MHNVIPKVVKYLLRIIFSIVLLILIIWLAKSNRNLSTYMSLLNQTNISDLRWWKILDIIRQKSESKKSDNKTTKSTWDLILQDENNTWLDVYDPQFEEDMQNASLDSMLSWAEEDFWFKSDSTWVDKSVSNTQTTTEVAATWSTKISDPQKNLLELIKQQEMKK
jgi:hypothetical protein